LGGFQLLDLHDYVGQGTALVGVLDPFWEEKGYVQADEWRQFCSPTVPLARLTQRIFTTADRLEAEVELAHWGAAPLTNCTVNWRVISSTLWPYTNGAWELPVVPIAGGTKAGRISVDLSGVKGIGSRFHAARIQDRSKVHGAEQMTLWVEGRGDDGLAFSNSWPFWVYPKPAETPPAKGILITSSWAAAEKHLADGREVLFLPRSSRPSAGIRRRWTACPSFGIA
jgi:beta-galactosidase